MQPRAAIINTAIQSVDGLNAPARALIVSKNVPEALGADLARCFGLIAAGSGNAPMVFLRGQFDADWTPQRRHIQNPCYYDLTRACSSYKTGFAQILYVTGETGAKPGLP